jgi:DNA-binding protein YbaB
VAHAADVLEELVAHGFNPAAQKANAARSSMSAE